MTLISVIIPIYKVEKYLRQCLDSIISQTYKNLEIILIDDGSPDNSGQICDEYAEKDNRIKVVHKENAGVSEARNSGLKVASGDYISFIDADDWIEEDMYENMLNDLERERVDIVRCNYVHEDGQKTVKAKAVCPTNKKYDISTEKEKYLSHYFNGDTASCLWLLLIKGEIIYNNKIMFESSIDNGEDLVFVIETLCHANSIYISKEYFYHYRRNPNGATLLSDYAIRNLKNVLALNNVLIQILKNDNLLTDFMQKQVTMYCFKTIYNKITNMSSMKMCRAATKSIVEDSALSKVLANLNKSDLSLTKKIFVYLAQNKCKNILSLFCVIVSFVKHRIIKLKQG